jgi:hypothetical protein
MSRWEREMRKGKKKSEQELASELGDEITAALDITTIGHN